MLDFWKPFLKQQKEPIITLIQQKRYLLISKLNPVCVQYPFHMDTVMRVEPESNLVQSELVRSHDVTKPS